MLYMISYDLNKPGQNYSELYKAIKNCGVWWHHLDSTLTTNEIYNKIIKNIDKNDTLVYKISYY